MKAARLLMILAVAACADREEPRVSLGGSQAKSAAPDDAVHAGVQGTGQQDRPGTLPPAAKAALDSGNTLYRAKQFEDALGQYRSAAKLAPNDAAPYFGIFMAASRLGRTKEADEAQRMINQLSGDSSGLAPHQVPKPTPRPSGASSQ